MQILGCQDRLVVALPLGKFFSQPHMSYGEMFPHTFGVPNVVMCPRVMHQSEMFPMLVIVHVWEQSQPVVQPYYQ